MDKEVKKWQDFVKDFIGCMKPIEWDCLCLCPPNEEGEDAPWYDPKNHSDFCPIYLFDYIETFYNEHANPGGENDKG